ncbi:MAG TPA: phosphopantetheine-binding protein, partial [Jatrophihabitans sp.]|nr:phosphopantetheine-binding protein [Jatrophihabitans sp.]
LEPVNAWREGAGQDAGEVDEAAAPRTPMEERLERIWAEVLELPRVGIDRSLFELGADSLRATQLLSRIREVFGVELSFDALWSAPTIAELAAVLAGEGSTEQQAALLRPVARGGDLPLSFAQRRLWFLHQLDPLNPVHNVAAAVRVEGALAPAPLAAALSEIVRRHEALRTGFAMAPGPALVPVVTVLSARSIRRFGPRPLVMLGSVLFAAAMLWQVANVTITPDYLHDLLPSMVLGGSGVGLALGTMIATAVTSLPGPRSATGSAMVNADRQIAAAVGVAILVSLIGVRVQPDSIGHFRTAWFVAAVLSVATAAIAAGLPRPSRAGVAPQPVPAEAPAPAR